MNFKFYTLSITSLLLCFTLNTSFAQIPTDGLVGYFMLDGNAGDASGMANHGTIVDQVSPTMNRFDEDSTAYLFDGGHINTGNPVDFQINDAISIAAWINPTEIDGWAGIVTKWSADDGGFYLGTTPDGILRWNIAGDESTNGEYIPVGEWVHIAATFDGDSIKTYQNGILTSSVFNGTPIADNTENLVIGTQSNGLPSSFLGAIDDVLIYNRGLSAEEVDMIFNPQIPISTNDLIIGRSVDLYPSPTTDILNIKNNSEHQILSSTLYNATGMKLSTTKFQEELDMSDQPAGTYYLILNFEDGLMTKKVLKL